MIYVLNMPTYKQSVNATDEWLVYARHHLASTSALSNASIGDEFTNECENSAYSMGYSLYGFPVHV